MTFKHVKFEDSPTMRALEKVAREKGLVKPETMTKKASLVKKADLTPSDNLMENIVKLCAGLREQGLVKDAAEIETNYLRFKQAQTLYETSKETGEDLLDQAHPEGSHKLENVDSTEAVVEDLIEKHEKTEEVAEKKPGGKLSDAKSVIKAVKKALGQADAGEPKYSAEDIGRWYRVTVDNKLWAALQAAVAGLDIAQRAVKAGFVVQDQTFGSDYTDMATAIQKANTAWQTMHTGGGGGKAAPTMEGINAMKEGINEAINRLDAFNQEGQAMRSQTEAKFREALGVVNQMATTVQSYNADPNSLPPNVVPPQAPAVTAGGYNDYKKQLNNIAARYSLYESRHDYDSVPPSKKQKIVDYLGKTKEALDALNAWLDKYKGDDATIVANKADLDSRIAGLNQRLNTYKSIVIDKQPQTGPGGK